MKRTKETLLAASLAALTFTGTGRASEPSASTWSRLPIGTPTSIPTGKRPAFVGGREKAPGLFVKKGDTFETAEVFGVPPTGSMAERIEDPTQRHVCFSEAAGPSLDGYRERTKSSGPVDWLATSEFQAELRVFRRTKDTPELGVSAVHAERFVERDGVAALDMVDAWVDPESRGARTIAKATLPLVLVAKSSQGVRVFAARTEVGPTPTVQFVLVPDPEQRRPTTLLWAVDDARMFTNSECGHIRLAVPVTEDGATASLFAPVIVGHETVANAEPARRSKRRGPLPADRDTKFRPLAAQVSVSKTSRDPEPVVSVSFGWAGRESADGR